LPHSVYRGAGWESWAATGKKATHSRESSGGHHAQTPLRLYVILHATLGVRVAMGCGTCGPLGNPTTGWRWRCADPLGTCGPLGNFMGCGTFCPLGNPTTGWRWRCAERTVFCLLGGGGGGTGDSFPLVSACVGALLAPWHWCFDGTLCYRLRAEVVALLLQWGPGGLPLGRFPHWPRSHVQLLYTAPRTQQALPSKRVKDTIGMNWAIGP
jgi:hypothetical protein